MRLLMLIDPPKANSLSTVMGTTYLSQFIAYLSGEIVAIYLHHI